MAVIVGCRLASRGVLRLSGRDARSLLQSLVTADVALSTAPVAPPPPLVAAAFLNRRGRVAFDAFVVTPVRGVDGDGDDVDPTALYLDVAAARAADAVAHLRRHRVRARVAVEDVSASVGVYVAAGGDGGGGGSGDHDALSLLTARPARVGEAVGVDPRLPDLGVRAVATVAAPSLVRRIVPNGCSGGGVSTEQPHSPVPLSVPTPPPMDAFTAWTLLRMIHGVPEGAADFPPPRDAAASAAAGTAATGVGAADTGRLPLEMGLDLLGAISFAKGCYLGQELTARSHHTGVTRRRLAPLLLLPRSLTAGVSPAALDADLRVAVAEATAAAAAAAVEGEETGGVPSASPVALLHSSAAPPVGALVDPTVPPPSAGATVEVAAPDAAPDGEAGGGGESTVAPGARRRRSRPAGMVTSALGNVALAVVRVDAAFDAAGEPRLLRLGGDDGRLALPLRPVWWPPANGGKRAAAAAGG
ncbi:hypothetical protein MMPV_008684 [Pyropia vietnamensis]